MPCVYTTRNTSKAESRWKDLVEARIAMMCASHGRTRKVCSGIDIRRSAPFVRRDLMHAHELLDVTDDDGTVCGFAFVKIQYAPLYVSLIVSLKSGVGHFMMHELQTTTRYTHPKMVVRSTDKALGFYLKLKFRLFDWSTLETGYVGDGDEVLTRKLDGSKEKMQATREELLRRNWLNDDELEWPLVLPRARFIAPGTTRRSSRLRDRHEASLLQLPREVADRTF